MNPALRETFTLRAMEPCDYSFILDSWLRSFKNSPRGCRLEDYWTSQRKTCEHLLGTTDVLIASPKDWPEGILGWICGETQGETCVVHYVYSKKAVQKMGLASFLVFELRGPSPKLAYTHLRPPFSLFIERLGGHYDRGLIRKAIKSYV